MSTKILERYVHRRVETVNKYEPYTYLVISLMYQNINEVLLEPLSRMHKTKIINKYIIIVNLQEALCTEFINNNIKHFILTPHVYGIFLFMHHKI